METIAHLVVGSAINTKPSGHDLLKAGKLDEVVGSPQKDVVAPNDLKPIKPFLANFQECKHIAGDVWVSRATIRLRKVNRRVPDL